LTPALGSGVLDGESIHLLRRVIRELHGCESELLGCIEVSELVGDTPIWQGQVQVFQLIGHARARLCFAWIANGRFYAVLESPIVRSPLDAVKFAHVSASEPLVNEISRRSLELGQPQQTA